MTKLSELSEYLQFPGLDDFQSFGEKKICGNKSDKEEEKRFDRFFDQGLAMPSRKCSSQF